MAAPSFTTTTGTELLPTSQPKPASPTRVDGPRALAGSTTTGTAGSISLLPTTSSGLQRIISTAVNTGPGTAPTAIRATTRASALSSITTITTAHSPT